MTTLIAGAGGSSKRARPSTAAAFSPRRALVQSFASQRDRWILWLPVGAILGAAAWLAAPVDPPWWLSGAVFAACGVAACVIAFWPSARIEGWGWNARRAVAGVLALVAFAGLGGVAAQVRTAVLSAPPFVATDGAVIVEGWVTAVEPSESGPRLRLLVRAVGDRQAPPRYVRIAVPDRALLTPGRPARCRAELAPPAGPMAPGAYDFARRAYFERLGAAGFGYGRCRPAAFGAPASLYDQAQLRLAALRYDLSAAIQDASPGRGGAIAAALVTGDRSGVDEETNHALRDSGLGHLLSVSGVHMGVVGGLVFAALLWTLSLIPPLALRLPVKKLAAAGALIALGAYLVVSGSSVPALRSYVMAGVAFGAILLDRPAISMRGLALAALIVVLIFPDSVLEPGFQMSFAATMALVALFEMMRRSPEEGALPTPGLLIGSLQWIARGIGGVIVVSLVAGLATDPFAIYHFQRFSIYSLAANLAVAPIMSFLVAPAAGVAAVLAPFGLAEAPLQVMASALDLVAAIGETFGSRPEAVRALPRPPDIAFAAAVLALVWTCVWRGRLRWVGAPLFALAVALYIAAPQPVAAFDGDLRAVFARGDSGWMLAQRGGRSTYARDRLGAMLGLSPTALERMAPPESCSETSCAWTTPRGRGIVLVRRSESFDAACREDAIVLARNAPPPDFAARCRIAMLIDARDLARSGGGLLYEDARGVRMQRALGGSARAWTPRSAAAED